MKHRATILAAALALSMSVQAEERPPIAGIYGGFGNDGSGSLMADYYPVYQKEWWKKVRISAQLWNGGSNYVAGGTTTTTTVRVEPRCSPAVTTTTTTSNLPSVERSTDNFAVGAAWCPTFAKVMFACVGLAYLANDDTANIDQHIQANTALGGTIKGWRVFGQHYSDGSNGSSETFLMAGKQFAVK